jgi:hypothetical protein
MLKGVLGKKQEKPKSSNEIKAEISSLKSQLKDTATKEAGGDPIAGRLKFYGFDQEKFEKYQHRYVPTEFPYPARRFRIMMDDQNHNIEDTYYWFLKYLNEYWGYEEMIKVIDANTSSVSSSTFGNLQSRLSAQQNMASQYLKGISEMIKGLFQIVREIRVIDERLQYYYDSDGDKKGNSNNALSSEIVLKGLWVDQVEGGAKNPGSVYGLSQTIGFTILPDLFFRVRIKNKDNLEEEVDSLKFNEKVKEVLKRKLRQYYEWKWRTKKELETRRDFEIKYMKQHYDTIKLYMTWVKPYLRNIRRLQLYEKNVSNANLIQAFESQIIELETLFVRNDFGKGGSPGSVASVISLHMFYRVKPELSFHAYEYQNKGPIHSGKADITIRAYAWSKEEIENYKKYREDDELDLMTSIDKSIESAMDALGDDLKKYLKEADPNLVFPGDEPKKPSSKITASGNVQGSIPDFLDPFVSIFKGFGDIAKGFVGSSKPKAEKPAKAPKKTKEKKKDESYYYKDWKSKQRPTEYSVEACFKTYNYFKMHSDCLFWLDE